ncbi:hypothetical protein GOODEAATRI_015736 [Goodea atripinnis]|uniref:Uncharacterized protein n=1 Tax=Goodea atripinnis TaxID=208336 RepID=A0ABV0PYB7_9TELE
MPNTILTLIYNIIKVKRGDTLNVVQTISYVQSAPPGLLVFFCNKHGKYKNKDPGIKLFRDCLQLVILLIAAFSGSLEKQTLFLSGSTPFRLRRDACCHPNTSVSAYVMFHV